MPLNIGINPLQGTGIGDIGTFQQTLGQQQPMMGQQQNKSLSFQDVQKILSNKPEGVTNQEIFKGLIQKGYTFPGLNDAKTIVDNQTKLKLEKATKKSFGQEMTEDFKKVIAPSLGFLQGLSEVGQKTIGKVGQLGEYVGEKLTGQETSSFNEVSEPFANITENTTQGKVGKKIGQIAGTTALNPFTYVGGGSLLKLAAEGAIDTALYSGIIEGRLPTKGELAIGTLLPPAIVKGTQAATKGLKSLASSLELSGLLNPAKLDNLRKQLIVEGVEGSEKAKPEDVARFMFDRGIKGDKEQIVEQLNNVWKSSKEAVDNALSKSNTIVSTENKPVVNALNILRNELEGDDLLRSEYDDIVGTITKLQNEGLNLAEVNNIKRQMDEIFNIYNKSGEVKAGLKAKGADKIRKELKTFIEKQADTEGLGNIKLMNNETSIAYGLADAISRKESADATREIINFLGGRTPGAIVGGTLGYNVGPFNSDTLEGKIGNVLFGALAGGALGSTRIKTNVASFINKWSPAEKNAFVEILENRSSKLPESTLKKVKEFFNDMGGAVVEKYKQGPIGTGKIGQKKGFVVNPFSKGEKLPQVTDIQNYKGIDYPKIIYHGTSKEINGPLKGGYFTDNIEYAKHYQSPTSSSISKSSEFYKSPNNPGIYETKLNPKEVFDIRKPEDLKIFNNYLETDSLSGPGYGKSSRGLVDWTEGEYLKLYLDEKYPGKYKWVALDEGGIPDNKGNIIDRGISFGPINPIEINIKKIK